MADISKVTVGTTTYNVKDSSAICELSADGKTVTYKKRDGTSGTITTQDTDTTYSDATASASGLMSANDKAKIDGIESGANKFNYQVLTQAEYDSIAIKDTDKFYFIKE